MRQAAMPRTTILHDRAQIAEALSRHRLLHLYALGDLDDFFFPYSAFYALEDEGKIRQIALAYIGTGSLVLHALAGERPEEMGSLLRSLVPLLPRRFYAHLSPGLSAVLEESYTSAFHGLHLKMALTDTAAVHSGDVSEVVPLAPSDRQELEALYAAAYPGSWFDPRMLETHRYTGVRRDARLVSVAGIHVYSPAYGVAALGNVTTHPAYRGKGLAASAIRALCRLLVRDCRAIGLNVHADNQAAIGLYQRLGFSIVGSYEEHDFTLRR